MLLGQTYFWRCGMLSTWLMEMGTYHSQRCGGLARGEGKGIPFLIMVQNEVCLKVGAKRF